MKRQKLFFTKPFKWLYKKTASIGMPGNKEVSVYAVMEFFIRNIGKSELNLRASSLAFTFFLAMFPTVIFFFTLIAYLPLKYTPDEILFFVADSIPANAYETIKETLLDILKNQRGDLLSVGFISAMYFSTNGFHNLMILLNKYSHFEESRPFWKQRLVAIGLSFFITILILFSVVMVTTGTLLISYLEKVKYFPTSTIPSLISFFNLLIVGLIVMGIVGAIYFIAPAHKRHWKFFNSGAIFASSVILITTYGFSQYVNHFNSYNKVYGSIGVLIVIMMLIYINTFILLLGYDLNVALDLALRQESKNRNRRSNENRIIFLEDRKDSES
ncbi:MAG: YihY/virulence factor BrkB family protein [Bacteroidia bacterium]|nr:YihY/virulence factor BrkB family protein [Bacteroidia bacterium]MCF8447025.1 YihY/virulence factor BrkB family protein [Bacteroidia bacterium]